MSRFMRWLAVPRWSVAVGSLCLLTAPSGVALQAREILQPAPPAPDAQVLAPAPFCEASAALAAPWDESLVVVADNEREAQLYAFKLEDGGQKPDEVWQMPAKNRPHDLEALARLGDDLVAVGSQSRNKRCEPKENRQRLRRLGLRKDGTLEETGVIDSAKTWADAMGKGTKRCLAALFVSPPPPGAEAACEALVTAEKEASEKRCQVVNVEGAFGDRDGRLWLGLRAPLAGGRAVLLRMVHGFKELRFDRVALLDLEGRGVRELAVAGDHLYGIAGPELDADVPFALLRASLAEVLAGGEPTVEILRRDLLTSSEGLLVRAEQAYVFVDGDAGEGGAVECRTPAGWYEVDVP